MDEVIKVRQLDCQTREEKGLIRLGELSLGLIPFAFQKIGNKPVRQWINSNARSASQEFWCPLISRNTGVLDYEAVLCLLHDSRLGHALHGL